MYGGMWISELTVGGVERDLTLLRGRMKEWEDAIGWSSTGSERRIMFIPYNEYQYHI